MEETKKERDIRLIAEEIAYWDKIGSGEEEDKGEMNGPLCREYFLPQSQLPRHDPTRCTACPVFEKTGRRFCRGTPYFWWQVHHRGAPKHDDTRIVRCPRCAELTMAMRVFFENFLEEEYGRDWWSVNRKTKEE